MKTYKIQEEIIVDQEWIDKLIEKYDGMPPTFKIGFGNFSGNKKDIIKEIKGLTDNGKQILLMEHRFQVEFPKWMKDFEKTPFGKAGKELMKELDKGIDAHRLVECDLIAENDLKNSKEINLSQVFDEELEKITDKNISQICDKQ